MSDLKATDVKPDEFKLYINQKGSQVCIVGNIWFDMEKKCYCAQVNDRNIQESADCDFAILRALTDFLMI